MGDKAACSPKSGLGDGEKNIGLQVAAASYHAIPNILAMKVKRSEGRGYAK